MKTENVFLDFLHYEIAPAPSEASEKARNVPSETTRRPGPRKA